MKKIMFNDRYGLTEAVLSGRKTQTRRIIKGDVPLGNWSETVKHSRYQVDEVVAVAQPYVKIASATTTWLTDKWEPKPEFEAGWTNKMFVRAEACKNQIRITKVRVERLQDISDEDCLAEGIYKYHGMRRWHYKFNDKSKGTAHDHKTPREAYAALIDKISSKGTWDSNPYVFVYDFELVK